MKQQEYNRNCVNITTAEKRISKFILYAIAFVVLSGKLSAVYPTRSLLADFVVAFFLGIGGVLAIAMATRDAVRGAKKVIEVSRRYSGKLTVSFSRFKNSKPQIFSGRRYICRARTNARSYHSAARPVFVSAAGGGESESDSSGDPPEPLPYVAQSKNPYQKLDSNLFKRRHVCVPGCWLMPCCGATQKVVKI